MLVVMKTGFRGFNIIPKNKQNCFPILNFTEKKLLSYINMQSNNVQVSTLELSCETKDSLDYIEKSKIIL